LLFSESFHLNLKSCSVKKTPCSFIPPTGCPPFSNKLFLFIQPFPHRMIPGDASSATQPHAYQPALPSFNFPDVFLSQRRRQCHTNLNVPPPPRWVKVFCFPKNPTLFFVPISFFVPIYRFKLFYASRGFLPSSIQVEKLPADLRYSGPCTFPPPPHETSIFVFKETSSAVSFPPQGATTIVSAAVGKRSWHMGCFLSFRQARYGSSSILSSL